MQDVVPAPKPLPWLPLTVVGGAIAAAFLLVAIGPSSIDGHATLPQAPVLAERMLVFTDLANHGVGVFENGAQVAEFDGEQGFVRGVMRGMMRGRVMRSLPANTPFRLAAYTDGHLVLDDPATSIWIDLAAYGSDNEAVFAHLLPIQAAPPPDYAQ